MASNFYDAVIIGGGPAGSFAARSLARLGWRVLLIDRRPRGDGKSCGHCLAARALPLLEREGLLDDVRAIATGSTSRCRIHLPGSDGAPIVVRLDEASEGGVVVRRDLLDALLLERAADAGTEIIQPATATPWRIGENGASVEVKRRGNFNAQRVECRLLVAADGLASRIARAAGIRTEAGGSGAGISWEGDGPASGFAEPGVIDMFIFRGGYLGAVRARTGEVHFGAFINRRSCSARTPHDVLTAAAAEHPRLRPISRRLERSGVRDVRASGPMPSHPRHVARGCLALIGDAAGFAAPLTGEGITWALESADLLGRAAVDCGAERPDLTARRYADLFNATILPCHRMCTLAAWCVARPWLLQLLAAPRRARGVVACHLAARLAAPRSGAPA